MNWKPMDTAPKDGRPVWARGNNYGDPAQGQHCAWVYWDGAWKPPLVGVPASGGFWYLHLTEWLDVTP